MFEGATELEVTCPAETWTSGWPSVSPVLAAPLIGLSLLIYLPGSRSGGYLVKAVALPETAGYIRIFMFMPRLSPRRKLNVNYSKVSGAKRGVQLCPFREGCY